MKRVMLLACMTAAMTAALSVPVPGVAASSDEPDLVLSNTDVSFAVNPIHYSASASIDAVAHNTGICYIVLGDNNDQTSYNFAFSSGNIVRMKARVRSTNGNLVTGAALIGLSSAGFTTSSTTWEEVTTGQFTVPGSSNSRLDLKVISGGDADTDLEVDVISVELKDGINWVPLFQVEAEDYDLGGNTVNHIYPQNVQVTTYNGDPDGGGVVIGGPQVVGGDVRQTTGGSVTILKAGASAAASTNWAPGGPPRHVQIYGRVDFTERDPSAADNTGAQQLDVYAVLTIVATGKGDVIPSPGDHWYYGTTESVTATNPFSLRYWIVDHDTGNIIRHTAPITVSMTEDHHVEAVYLLPGVSGWELALMGLLLLAGGAYAFTRRKERATLSA